MKMMATGAIPLVGRQRENTAREISETSGLSLKKVGPLMTTLAPIVMGMLGKTKRTQGLDASGLGGALTDLVRQQQGTGNSPALGMAERMLDRDGDGSAMDDIAEMGMKMLGGFFKR